MSPGPWKVVAASLGVVVGGVAACACGSMELAARVSSVLASHYCLFSLNSRNLEASAVLNSVGLSVPGPSCMFSQSSSPFSR